MSADAPVTVYLTGPLIVVGPEGSGRHSAVQSFIDKQAESQSTPNDWCYVFNFDLPHKPLALEVPPKQGPVFRQEMDELIDALKTTVPTVFEGDDYRAKTQAIKENLAAKVDKIYDDLVTKGKEQSIAVVRKEQGLVFTPMDGTGKPMDIEEFRKLPEDTQDTIEKNIEKLHDALQKAVHTISMLNREAKEKKRKLKDETAGQCIAHLIDTLKAKYAEQDKILHRDQRRKRFASPG